MLQSIQGEVGVYQAVIRVDLILASCLHCCFDHFFVSTFTFAFVLTGIQNLRESIFRISDFFRLS